ncbi:hypothetical protein ALI144C_01920 [Actinosynnema sp. ALI-1.44]|uniref:GOLPH3/VPS74 family protein n=1 Tax=Actinosynnema sp. ALI-1.44 TaxID=1933779 RepID=UPI00097BB17B|nr:GPP34 family phosphoprotein [Actinosynnema sp. ALI-1.44]ONI91004.1 hypothetical protein ALI144C_01920 [Actinosynnema sp. ALI-1.44]
MALAHELLLLMLDDMDGKVLARPTVADAALAGAVLVELTARGQVGITVKGEAGRKGRLVVRSHRPLPEPVLQHGLQAVHDLQGRKPRAAISRLAQGVRDQLAGDLVQAGIVRQESIKLMGLFTFHRFPAVNIAAKAKLRYQLSLVLSGETRPDLWTGTLIALLYAANVDTQVITTPDKRAAARRAKEIARGSWAAEAVQAMQAAVIAAVHRASAADSAG